MNRLERISSILVRLQSRSVVTARQIADQFGVSLRTVYRDIRVLEESGIPVTGEAGQGYSLVEGFKLPPLAFTTEEAIAFLMAEKLVSCQADGDMFELYRSGMDKIRAVLRTAEKNILENFDDCIQLIEHRPKRESALVHVLQPLLHCIVGKREVQIRYCTGYNLETTDRVVEPLGIFFMNGNWYLLAWCRLRKDYRTFNINRIRKLMVGAEGFKKQHDGLKTIIGRIYLKDVVYKVKLRVEKSALRDMGAGRYIYGLCREEQQGEYLVQDYETFSLEYFGRWYLSFADRASILEPEEFKDTVRRLVANIKL